MRLSPHSAKKRHYVLKTALLSLLFSALIFVPYMIYDGGYFLYYGDFNVQEVPFYQMVHDAIQSGNYHWSSTTDLGSGLIGSYSFYLLGSPFFWITMLFPSNVVPYLMGPLFILKFMCAALAGYFYLKRHVNNKDFAVIGALLYAFCGFSIYNIFFFHFHEAIIVFPLLLAALDAFMIDHRRGVMAVAVFAACIVNYYFFVGQVLFVIIYWIIMVCTKNYKLKVSQMFLLAFEVLLGFVATAVLLLPSVLSVSGNPRLQEYPNGWDALIHQPGQRYWYIILSFFFPPELPAFPNFTKDVNCNWASVSGWLPLFSMVGVIGYLQNKSRSWLKKILPLLFLMAMVPLFNSAFQLFNSSIYYARWFYMLELMLCLATVKALESTETNWERAFAWTTGITVGIAVIIGFMPSYGYSMENPDKIDSLIFGLERFTDRYWIYVACALVGLCLCALIIKKYKRYTKKLIIYTLVGIGIISTVTSNYIVTTGKTYGGNDKTFIIPFALNNGENLTMDDLDNVRSDFYECMDNLAMYWQIPSINAFHSVVSPSIMEFYDSIGITRDVASRPNTDYYALRGFLSCKYLFDDSVDTNDFRAEQGNEMPGWEYIGQENGCYVYENSYYIPMGFMFDTYITQEDWETLREYDRHLALTKALVLTEEQMEKYYKITDYYNYDGDKLVDSFSYSYVDYYNECSKLKENSCTDFAYNNNGFTATIENTGNDNLLFFSIPYDKGWTAYVNDTPVEIEKVDCGLMAIKVPGNQTSSIKFVYEQPGFTLGIIISIICGIIFLIYILLIVVFRIIIKNIREKRRNNDLEKVNNSVKELNTPESNIDNSTKE